MIGSQGSGKGTQLELLREYLKREDEQHETVVFQSGTLFRFFSKGGSYTALHIRDTIDTGMLQPLFLSVALWAGEMIDCMNDSVHALIEGFPRTLDEAHVLHSALNFYKREKRLIIILDAPEDVVRKRMELRARADDTPESIERRLLWYRTETISVFNYFDEMKAYRLVHIDALQSIEKVHADIVAALKDE